MVLLVRLHMFTVVSRCVPDSTSDAKEISPCEGESFVRGFKIRLDVRLLEYAFMMSVFEGGLVRDPPPPPEDADLKTRNA